jgi:hypothetical protein
MQENPYAAPESEVMDNRVSEQIPEEITKKIKTAYTAAIVSGCLTLLLVLISVFAGSIANMNAWGLVDVVLIFGLAYGVYRKSRTAAVILLVYFVLAKIYMLVSAPAFGASGLVMGAVFAYFYYQGVVGTFQYHGHVPANSGPA